MVVEVCRSLLFMVSVFSVKSKEGHLRVRIWKDAEV